MKIAGFDNLIKRLRRRLARSSHRQEHSLQHGRHRPERLRDFLHPKPCCRQALLYGFQLHGLLELCDEGYRLTRYHCFDSWGGMMDFMMRGLEIGPYETDG